MESCVRGWFASRGRGAYDGGQQDAEVCSLDPVRAGPRSIALFYLATSLFWASMYVYLPVLPVHAEVNLGATMGLVGTIVGAYGFAQLLLRIPLGIWSDRVGLRKPFILAGLAAAVVGALGMGLTADPRWLVLWRGMSGVGAAAWVAFTVLFSSYFAPQSATRAMAYLVFVSGFSQMLTTYAGGVIAQHWGWTAPFFVSAALGLLGILVALPLEEKPVAVRRAMSGRQLMRISTVPLLVAVSGIAMLSSWNQWATANGFSLVYAAGLGATRADLGLLTMAYQAAFTVTSLASAFAADRVGVRATVVASMVIQSIAALMVPLVHSLPLMLLSQLLVGVRGICYPVLMGMSIRAVPAEDRATAMGIFQAVYALGMWLGPGTTGFLADSFGIASVFLVAGASTLLAAAAGAGLRLKG